MKISAPQNFSQPTFKALYATKGSFAQNKEFTNKLVEECEITNERYIKTSKKHLASSSLKDSVYQFDLIQLTPKDADYSIQLIATNENANDLAKFVNSNKYKFDMDLYSGEKVNNSDIRAKQFFEIGEIDNFLDCLLEKRKQLEMVDPMDTSKKIVREFRKSVTKRLGFIPIIDVKKALEVCKNDKFDFIKGIVKTYK